MRDQSTVPSPLSHRHIDVEEIEIHVLQGGADDAPALLFLHGWPEDCTVFEQIMSSAWPRGMLSSAIRTSGTSPSTPSPSSPKSWWLGTSAPTSTSSTTRSRGRRHRCIPARLSGRGDARGPRSHHPGQRSLRAERAAGRGARAPSRVSGAPALIRARVFLVLDPLLQPDTTAENAVSSLAPGDS